MFNTLFKKRSSIRYIGSRLLFTRRVARAAVRKPFHLWTVDDSVVSSGSRLAPELYSRFRFVHGTRHNNAVMHKYSDICICQFFKSGDITFSVWVVVLITLSCKYYWYNGGRRWFQITSLTSLCFMQLMMGRCNTADEMNDIWFVPIISTA
jgi:hypothetical protein